MATYWENSCSFGLRYVSWYKCLIVSLVFSHLGFWSGNLFLIAPFPDLCLLVPFSMHTPSIVIQSCKRVDFNASSALLSFLEKSTMAYEPPRQKNQQFAYAKTKVQISFAVTLKLISAYVFATRKVQTLFFLNPKLQASSHLGLCRTWSETHIVGFLTRWFICFQHDSVLIQTRRQTN